MFESISRRERTSSGAIRLPNDTFKAAAGTEVTSDIIFLQKRDRLVDIEPDWVHLATDANGIRMNAYFVDNPEMVLGDMQMVSGPHGMEPACIAYENAELGDLLRMPSRTFMPRLPNLKSTILKRRMRTFLFLLTLMCAISASRWWTARFITAKTAA